MTIPVERKIMQWLAPVVTLKFGMRDADSGYTVKFGSGVQFGVEVEQT